MLTALLCVALPRLPVPTIEQRVGATGGGFDGIIHVAGPMTLNPSDGRYKRCQIIRRAAEMFADWFSTERMVRFWLAWMAEGMRACGSGVVGALVPHVLGVASGGTGRGPRPVRQVGTAGGGGQC